MPATSHVSSNRFLVLANPAMDPDSWLHDELRRLQRENKALRRENEDLAVEIFTSQEESKEKVNAYDKILQEISYLRKPFSQPPPEILHMVFERTIPPYFIIDTSASLCLNPMWYKVQQQKKFIVEVCRAWYTVGLPFLWEDIVIRRVYELSNLLMALQDAPLKLRSLTKRVEIHCFVPLWYEEPFARQLQLLFVICPRISSCSFLSQCSPPPKLFPTAMGNATTITSLTLSDGIPMDSLGPLLTLLSPYLVSLSFHVPSDGTPNVPDLPKCHLYHLQELTIWVSHSSSDHLSALAANRWLEIPCLKQLTFTLDCQWNHTVPDGCLRLFCKEYGTGIHFLQIHSRMLKSNFISAQALLDLCPSVEHLVIHPNVIGDFDSLTHRKIKWIDIWFNDVVKKTPDGSRRPLSNKLPRANFPALKGIRFLEHTYAFPYDLPLLIPPDLVSTPEDALSLRFLDFGMRHDFEQVYFVCNDWVAAVGSKPYTEEVPSDEYDTNEDDDGNESESAWSSEDESDGDESDSSSSSMGSETGSDLIIRNPGWDAEVDALETDIPLFIDFS